MSDYEFIDITNYSGNALNSSSCSPFDSSNDPYKETHLAIQEYYEYDGTPQSNIPQYITYIDHPTVVIEEKVKMTKEKARQRSNSDPDNSENLNMMNQFYFGSLTVIGLFIIFRILQLKK